MTAAKVFMSGRSQAVRLPKEYRFSDDEVYIKKISDIVMLIPKDNGWDGLIKSLDMFSEDFMKDGRGDVLPEERISL